MPDGTKIVIIKVVRMFETTDGKVFPDTEAAIAHQNVLTPNAVVLLKYPDDIYEEEVIEE